MRIIGDEFFAINNDEKLWKFYLDDFGPMIFQEPGEPTESTHDKAELQKKFLDDFQIVGKVRFQQVRTKKIDCTRDIKHKNLEMPACYANRYSTETR